MEGKIKKKKKASDGKGDHSIVHDLPFFFVTSDGGGCWVWSSNFFFGSNIKIENICYSLGSHLPLASSEE